MGLVGKYPPGAFFRSLEIGAAVRQGEAAKVTWVSDFKNVGTGGGIGPKKLEGAILKIEPFPPDGSTPSLILRGRREGGSALPQIFYKNNVL